MNKALKTFLMEEVAEQVEFMVDKWYSVATEKDGDQADLEFITTVNHFIRQFHKQTRKDGLFDLETAINAMAARIAHVALSLERQNITAVKKADGLWHVGTAAGIAAADQLSINADIDGDGE